MSSNEVPEAFRKSLSDVFAGDQSDAAITGLVRHAHTAGEFLRALQANGFKRDEALLVVLNWQTGILDMIARRNVKP